MSEEKTLSIADFGWLEVRMAGIILNKFEDEDDNEIYNVVFLLNIEDETEDGLFVHVPTQITNPDRLVACHLAAQVLSAFVDEEIIAHVSVFDENGDEVEEFNLNDETKKQMMEQPRVLH